MENNLFCPKCKTPIQSEDLYCRKCGKQLKLTSQDLSTGKQILIYLLSFFLAPLGLVPAIKYLKSSDPKAKKVGLVALILTVVASVITIGLSWGFAKYTANMYDDLARGIYN